MAKIFLSYHRQSKAAADGLMQDMETMGYTVWFDQELSGGQVWWTRILTMIGDCDAFVLVLDAESLGSVACTREYTYAADLRKPVLPVLTADDVSINLLPPALAQIQLVDCRTRDRGPRPEPVSARWSLSWQSTTPCLSLPQGTARLC